MSLLDYTNLNHSYLSNQINPFDQQKQDYYYSHYNDESPSEAELLCFDPLPPSLLDFDFDFDIPFFTPLPPPPLQFDYQTPLHFPTEDTYPYYWEKLSFPSFNGLTPEIQCHNYSHYQNYTHCNNNVGGGGGGDGGGCGGGVKEVTAQSRAARERRRKITEKTQELGKLVPGGTKMNTAQMFQAAFKYVKFLQAQLGLLNSINTLYQESDKEVNVNNLSILGSQLVQEKLYAKEKCLVPMDFLPIFKKHLDPSISKHINELLH